MGAQIAVDYAGKDLLLVGVLKGAVLFMSDLIRAIPMPCEVDFMAISSYGSGTRRSSGIVRILKDLDDSIEGRDVLIVEDIIDSGLTLSYLLRSLRARRPASLEIPRCLTEARAARVDIPCRLRRLRDPEPLRRRLRPRLRREVPQPAVRRGRGRVAPVALRGPRGWLPGRAPMVGASLPPSGSTVTATAAAPAGEPSSSTNVVSPPLWNVPAERGAPPPGGRIQAW